MSQTATASSSSQQQQPLLLAALSEDGSKVAVVVPSSSSSSSSIGRLTLQVFHVESKLLTTTLTTGKAKTAHSVAFCGNDHVVVRTADRGGIILVWDLKRGGVVAHEFVAEIGKRFLDVTCDNDQVYVLVGMDSTNDDDDDDDEGSSSRLKLQIHQYDATSGRLVRKVKCGKTQGNAISASELGIAVQRVQGKVQFLVRCASNKEAFRIIDGETGSKLSKHKFRDGKKHVKKDGSGGSGIRVCQNLVAIPRLACVALYNIKTQTWLNSIPVTSSNNGSVGSTAVLVHMWNHCGDHVNLIVGNTLYRFSANGTTAKVIQKLQSDHTMTLLPGSGSGSDSTTSSDEGLLAILHNPGAPGNQSSLQLRSIRQDSVDETVQWQQPSPVDDNEVAGGASSRRRPFEETAMTVLGPGQAGTEATNISERPNKRSKQTTSEVDDKQAKKKNRKGNKDENDNDDDDDDSQHEKNPDDTTQDPAFGMSIADRLKQLTQVMEEEDEIAERMEGDFNRFAHDGTIITHKQHFSKTATTDSLSELLTQALRGGNDDLLELGLAVQDRTMLEESTKDLDDHCLNLLLTKLTTRLAKSPNRASDMIVWFSAILSSGRIHEPCQLLPLKNLVQERVSTFPQMLQLEGRVSMMKRLKRSSN